VGGTDRIASLKRCAATRARFAGTLRLAPKRLRLEPLERRDLFAVGVVSSVETPNTSSADDAAIWIHPTDAAQSTIIGTIKLSSTALRVYDLAGNQLQAVDSGNVNNVDLRYNFPLAGQPTTLVVGSNRSNDSIAIYKVNPQTRLLEDVAARTISTNMAIYGAAMYVSPTSGKYYAFVTSESGQVQQWELFDDGSGSVDAAQVRSFSVGSISEGCVGDDVLGSFYVAEENVGIWKYSAEPDGGSARTQVDSVASPQLAADVEGLSIYYKSDDTGYLLVSSQGSDEFAVYRREGNNAYLGNFELIAGGGIDAVSNTDGIDVTNFPLGSQFPEGVFVAQDDDVNFKLARWDAIVTAFGGTLSSDTSWDPREVGAGTPTPASVVGRHVFYNESAFDGNNASINADDDGAIAPDKSPYLPGAGLAVYNNISNYSRGINGIMIDLAGGGAHASINANDFVFKVGNNNSPSTWAAAPAPSAVSVRAGAGESGSDRVEIIWADGAIKNTWLEVQALPSAHTGLAAPDVFFWGNRVGDTTFPATGGTFLTNVAGDGAAIVGASPASSVGIANLYDINRTNTVNVAGDRAQVVANSPGSLLRIDIGTGGPFAPQASSSRGADSGIAAALAATTNEPASRGAPPSAVSDLLPRRADERVTASIMSIFGELAQKDAPRSGPTTNDMTTLADRFDFDDELLQLLGDALTTR
jgi:3-phytase